MASSSSAWFIGEGTLLVRSADAWRAAGHHIGGIASADPVVRRWAESERIAVVDPAGNLAEAVARSEFDYLFSVVNLTRLDPAVIRSARILSANFHDGPLPAYAGLNAPVWALINGERRYGVTWHEMTDEVDAGRILTQQFFDVPAGETSFGLNARCYEAGLQAFGELVNRITTGTLEPRDQDLTARTLFRRYDRPEGGCIINWHRPADEILRLVRALDFGPYANPFAAPRLLTRGGAFLVGSAAERPAGSALAPGTVIEITGDAIVLATATTPVALTSVRRVTGEAVAFDAFAAEAGLREGDNLDEDTRDLRASLAPWLGRVARDEAFWIDRLHDLEPIPLPWAGDTGAHARPAGRVRSAMPLPDAVVRTIGTAGTEPDLVVLAAAAAFLLRLSGQTTGVVPLTPLELSRLRSRGDGVLSDVVPVRIDLDADWPDVRRAFAAATREAASHGTFFTDVVARVPAEPALKSFRRWQHHVRFVQAASAEAYYPPLDTTLAVVVDPDARTLIWDAASDRLPADAVARLQRQFAGVLATLVSHTSRPMRQLPLVTSEERATVLVDWNQTAKPVPEDTVQSLVARQAERTPDALALVCRHERLTYRAIDSRANQLAHYLRRQGVGPGVPVGLCLDRSVDLVVSLLAILKAGGAYVPLDPAYPRDRLAYIAEDVGLTTVIADQALAPGFPRCRLVDPVRDGEAIGAEPASEPTPLAGPADLAYVIYTSGSTGRPKGVMIEHRNVANFLVAMDGCVPPGRPGVWLAVTSVSFDISVLELLWTLARGFAVVLYTGAADTGRATAALSNSATPIDFSLFYFSADERSDGRDKYRLLLDGARFADAHGFSAVWTPERHFHAFGGLYPNPAVTGAAVAAITSRVKIRAGSCVLPLHHPLRVAEEWAVVDNLSNGRVGIAFASGWQPNDFILRPENYVDRKAVMLREIATVQALWRGEAVEWTTPRGEKQAVRTLPRPVQPALPMWLTAAGNPETFAAAAAAGAGVLTHLLGQSVDEVAGKIAAYRAAWRTAGHPGDGHVVLMLHTLVSDSDEFVRDAVRQPLMDYLRTSIDLVKPFAESFPTFAARPRGQSLSAIFASLTEADYDALVEHSFERYYQTSGLFGRPESCLAMIDRLKAIGVDEVACLVDFGVATEIVLDNLRHLNTLRERANGVADADDFSIPALIARHGVTHLQCTPSMARMLLLDPAARQSLGRLEALLVGGEALPPALAAELVAAVPSGEVWNMYGPTETTVWSTTWKVSASPVVSIGRPVANTQIYILDDAGEPVPPGLPGHLFIGGSGVARGYWGRPELTAERFRPNPFAGGADARVYFTGDLARYRDDGQIEFLGRSDEQVKVRGHRIELGEIEATIAAHQAVREAVVVAREDAAGDKRLVAYVVLQDRAALDYAELKAHLGTTLPEYLVPSHLVVLDAFPLTPNRKIDRRALPAPDMATRPAPPHADLAGDLERQIAAIWKDVLRAGDVGATDNFFDIGGDSLLAAQVLSLVRSQVTPSVSLTDLFRYPTVRTLAAHLGGESTTRVTESAERARLRQDALRQRRASRPAPSSAGSPSR